MSKFLLLITTLLLVVSGQVFALEFELKGDTSCSWGSKDCNRCVNDVKANFNAIETQYKGKRGSKIRVRSYAHPAKNNLLHRINARYEHIQGIGRIAGLGNDEYLVFTHSTSSSNPGKSGALAVVRMGANQKSNGFELGDLRDGDGENQNIHNRTVARTYSDSNHPGGLATLGHYVFVADWCQNHPGVRKKPNGEYFLPYQWCDDPSQYAFEVYDVSNVHRNTDKLNSNPPIKIIDKSVYKYDGPNKGVSTASIAATKLKSGQYLVGIGRSGGKNYDYYLSNTSQLLPNTEWSIIGDAEEIKKHGEGAAMVNECGSGDIYLIQIEKSADNPIDLKQSKDKLHLFKLKKDSNTGPIKHQWIDSQTFKCSDGTAWCDFDKGGGIYTSPTGNLYLYATDAQQAKETERFRMVEFGNYLESGYDPSQNNKLCEKSNIRLCGSNGATCDVLHGTNGSTNDVCRWSSKKSAAACKCTVGIWTTVNSKYAKNHPDAVRTGTTGACITEVNNIKNMGSRELLNKRYLEQQACNEQLKNETVPVKPD